MFLAGPGWVIFGAIKQIVGLFLAVLPDRQTSPTVRASPTSRCTSSWRSTRNFLPNWLALTLAVVLVVISQIKINVTNAYSGSLAWTNSFTPRHQDLPRSAVVSSGSIC